MSPKRSLAASLLLAFSSNVSALVGLLSGSAISDLEACTPGVTARREYFAMILGSMGGFGGPDFCLGAWLDDMLLSSRPKLLRLYEGDAGELIRDLCLHGNPPGIPGRWEDVLLSGLLASEFEPLGLGEATAGDCGRCMGALLTDLLALTFDMLGVAEAADGKLGC